MRKFSAFFLVFVFIAIPSDSGILFSDLDLAGDNRLLFRAGILNQEAFFITSLPERVRIPFQAGAEGSSTLTPRLLSAFPEKIDLLDSGRILQIRNSFGAMRLPVNGGLPMPIPGVPSFDGDIIAAAGRAGEMLSSPDGRWILYLHSVSPALGDLVMVDVQTGVRTLIASRLERPETVFPAAWSPDSRFFLYERGGKLFFYMAGSSLMPSDEKLRLVGDGRVNSISWAQSRNGVSGGGGDFYYLQGSTLYRVRGPELFARTLYADFLSIGTVAGKIPFEFDPGFDNFWLAPDALSMLISKGRRSLYCLPLNDDGAAESVLSYLVLPRYCSGVNVLWPADGGITVLVSRRENGGSKVNAWRLSGNSAFEPLKPLAEQGGFPQGVLSPDGSLALFWGDGGILLYDYAGWELIAKISGAPGYSCLWEGNDRFITGDNQKIERIRMRRGGAAGQAEIIGRELLCLSNAKQFAFEENSARILARSGDSWYATDGRNRWIQAGSPRIRNSSQVSAQYRVYLENQGSGSYENLPMVRNITSVGTFSLFAPRAGASQTGKLALYFDLYDDDKGLPETLDALNRFGIKATFFLNGEFIRRHPLAAADIIAAGHEAASMFFALIDLSDIRYKTDLDFITRGLARNEDEFFRVTGKELSLLWHSPWYTVSPYISDSAAKAGYATAGRDVDPMDWVSLDDEKILGLPLKLPAEMIDRILEKCKPGSVVPVRLGLLSGGRGDYLFNHINVLLDALVRQGYTLTTVSALDVK